MISYENLFQLPNNPRIDFVTGLLFAYLMAPSPASQRSSNGSTSNDPEETKERNARAASLLRPTLRNSATRQFLYDFPPDTWPAVIEVCIKEQFRVLAS